MNASRPYLTTTRIGIQVRQQSSPVGQTVHAGRIAATLDAYHYDVEYDDGDFRAAVPLRVYRGARYEVLDELSDLCIVHTIGNPLPKGS